MEKLRGQRSRRRKRETGDRSREKEEIWTAEAQQGGKQEDGGKDKGENRDS